MRADFMAIRLLTLGAALMVASAAPAPAQETKADLDAPAGERELTTRYRLVERYSANDAADTLTEYEVAFRETVRVSVETPQAAPRVEEVKRTGRYAERVAAVTPLDGRTVSTVVRRYVDASVTPNPWVEIGAPDLMSGLELLIIGVSSASPRLTVLTPDRSLWEHEYRFATGNPLTPSFAALLPDRPLRLGDTWALSPAGATALLGEPVELGTLTGTLEEIKTIEEPELKGTTEVAILELEGRLQTRTGPTVARARVEFAFRPIEPAVPSSGTNPTPRAFDTSLAAYGGIISIRHAQVTTVEAAQGGPGFERHRDLILRRRSRVDSEPLSVPSAPPDPTELNSWLLLVDAEGRFHLRHPQGLRWDSAVSGPDRVTLAQPRGEIPDVLVIDYREGEQPKPEEAFSGAFDSYKESGFEVLPRDPKALPADEWPGVSAYRVEAVISPPAEAATLPRTHMDGYLLLPGQLGAFQAMALTTSADEAQAFRALAESVLKTLKLGRP